mgnify:CR=1 FL=1
MKKLFTQKEILIYIFAIAVPISFATWMSLLNNFVVEVASFDGAKIGILQSLREIPGLLAFTVLFVLIIFAQQRLAYISLILLGIGTALTGFFPTATGLYITTVIMSLGFHYMETLNQSLTLQWISKERAPLVLGKVTAVRSFMGILVFGFIYVSMTLLDFDYKTVYLIGGVTTCIIAILAWILFDHFKEEVLQEKKIVLRKQYWLFYVLTFFAGARRQIFIVFAGFLLVEKFGMHVENMVLLLIANSALNMYMGPKIGRFVAKFGERIALKIEYFGLMIVFMSYAFVDSVYIAIGLFILDHLLFSMAIALKTYFQKIADPKDIASASAVSFTINHIAAVFLPFVLGLLWLQSSSLVFIIGACVAVLSFSLSFFIPKNPTMGCETTLKVIKVT